MKNLLLLTVILFCSSVLSAQVCGNPKSQIDLHGNNIQARILNGGDLFWDFTEARFIPNPSPTGAGPATIFAAGLWLGGVDPAGDLKLAAVTYRHDGKADYFAGPLDENGETNAANCTNWDLHFRVRGDRITAFIDSLPFLAGNPALAIVQFRGVMGWPGRGNPYFSDLWGFELPTTSQPLAPFYDADANGLYDPLQGDYPAVSLQLQAPFVPTEMIWCVFNDQGAGAMHAASGGKPFGVEVQLTAWAFDSLSQPTLNNTVFTSHKMIFRMPEAVDSCFVGMWVDFDLGCGSDDYVGSAPALDAFYAYNQDVVDGSPGNACPSGGIGILPTFEGIPPVQSVTFLSLPLDKCIYYNNSVSSPTPPAGTYDPQQSNEYYNYLTGHWRDGLPLTYGGSGYLSNGAEVNHAFPDDPADSNGWSMCTAGLVQSDRRMIGIHQLGQVVPGQMEELNVAWTVHPNPDLPCGLGATFPEIAALRNLYDNNFVTATTMPLLELPLILSPNPATNTVTLQYDDLSVLEIRCFDAAGRLMGRLQSLPAHQYTLDIAGWKTGTYTIHLLTGKGSVARRLVLLR